MPVLFVGHGSPMNAIEDNRWSQAFAALAAGIPTPSAILAISAHWYTCGSYVTGEAKPKTIHDFGGFPKALFDVQYPAPGSAPLADRVCALLSVYGVTSREDWGLDHGTWSVLVRMYPEARIPVVQLSLDRRLTPAAHIDLGRALTPLRDEGVLILASGNIVHNLRDAFTRMHANVDHTPDWAARVDALVARALVDRDTDTLATVWPDTADGQQAHPSPDHWLPLLYAYGASTPDDRVTFPIEGFDAGSLSMRAVSFG